MSTVVKRMKKHTPSFFKKVRNVGLALASISAAVLTAPVALPAICGEDCRLPGRGGDSSKYGKPDGCKK